MTDKTKLLGDERREVLLELLKESGQPLTGNELAKRANVSRQVIVGDITLLKARNEPILATSQGYIYIQPLENREIHEKIVACIHKPERAEEELNLLVDLGITVKDVKIEHPVYGDLTASIMVSNRKEVKNFMEKVNSTNATYLSELTNGVHLHTLSAPNEKLLNEAEEVLRQANLLMEN